MLCKHMFNRKGITLIELIIAMGIFAMIATIAYPMLSMTFRTSYAQLQESNQRNEVRAASAFLKSDIEYSREITVNTTSLQIVNSRGESINYSIASDSGANYLIRNKGSASTSFKDIQNVEFRKLNDHLIYAKLINDVPNSKYSEFKLYRFNMTVDTPRNETVQEYIIKNKIFVLGNEVAVNGSSTVSGTDAAVIVKGGAKYSGGGVQYIATKDIYINGPVTLESGAGIGKTDNTSSIYINGSCTVTGSSRIFGNTIIKGNLSLASPNLKGNIYVDGNVSISGGSYETFRDMPVEIYYTGTLTKPDYYGAIKATKVTAVQPIVFPTIDIPLMPADSWYADRGYTSNATLRNNMKYHGSTLTFRDWGSNSFANVVIASKGDIILDGNVHVTGVLYAPNGRVTIDGSSTFKGLIFAKQTYVVGNAHVTFQTTGINDLPF